MEVKVFAVVAEVKYTSASKGDISNVASVTGWRGCELVTFCCVRHSGFTVILVNLTGS